MNTTNPLFKSQIDLSNIRAVWLDVDQTLLDFDQSARYALIKTFERYHLDWKDEYFEIFLRENGKLWDQIEDGHLTRPQLRKIRFQVMFKAWQIPFDPPVEFEQYFSYDLHHCAFPMEGANQALDYFESLHLPLFIISNGPMEGQCNRLEMGGMLSRFTRVFTSESLGVAKPDPAFFQQALAQTNRDLRTSLNPDQILVIGDSWKADISGALACGMPALWLRTNRKHDPFEVTPHPEVVSADDWKEALEALSHCHQ